MKLGLDLGNSTIKVTLLDSANTLIYKESFFHLGKIENKVLNIINSIETKFKEKTFFLAITGDNSKKFLKLKKYIINEIPCSVEGTKFLYPEVKTIIDIGGQNSKYITNFSSKTEQLIFATNTSCSAGTGSFLEEQASRLKISLDEISTLCRSSKNMINIAGRCSVFSKTDITHHHQEGAKIDDILMGLCTALIRNFKGNVIKRQQLETPILLIGGLSSNYGINKSLKTVLQLKENELIVNKDFNVVTAFGAALLSREKISIEEFKNIFEKEENNIKYSSSLNPLKNFGINDSLNKHNLKGKEKTNEGYLGIDIGSTSTNLVVTDEDGDVISYKYLRTKGDPISAVENGLEEIAKEFPNGIAFKSIVTTGSGRYLIGKKLNADDIINEITTQAKAASHMDKDVDTIFEIGGQDSKYIHIENGIVDDFEMNKICAAGTGSFLEEQSLKLGTPIEDFSAIALKGEAPCDLGERCTVFIEGSINKAISENISYENIYSGLCYSIVKNYLNGVVGNRTIGKKIFLQGGIAYNQGVVNAFRAITGREIIVPSFFSVTGAYGASLYAKEVFDRKSTDSKESFSEKIDYKKQSKEIFLEDYIDEIDPSKKTVGIPRVLFFYKLFPIFNKFFRSLGYNVILSDETSNKTINLSRENSTHEICYPIKLANGHVAELLAKGVDYIFLPNLHEVMHHSSTARTNYSCMYMQSVGKIVESNINFPEKKVVLLNPSITFKFGKTYIAKTLLEMCETLGVSKFKGINAIKNSLLMYARITNHMENIGKTVIENAKKDEKIFVIMAREYDVADPILNMGISKKLEDMGYKVLSIGNLEAFSLNLEKDYPNMYWPFGQHLLAGAKIVKDTQNLYAIHITNHGCGPDSILSHYFKQEMSGKPYLHIEVDEHSSSVGIITRLEAFVNSLEGYTGKNINWNYKSHLESNNQKIYIPYMYPLSNLLKEKFKKEGNSPIILPQSTAKSLNVGKKFIKGKEYLSLTNILGDIFSNITKEDEGVIFLPQDEGGEISGQYAEFINRKLYEEKYKVKVFSPFLEDIPQNNEFKDYFYVTILSDLIMNSNYNEREKYIELAKNIINSGITEDKILKFTNEIKKGLLKLNRAKNLLVIGEFSVLMTPTMNKNLFEALEKKYHLYYSPYSEGLLFKWISYFNSKKVKDFKLYSSNINNYTSVIEKISKILGVDSPYSESISKIEDYSKIDLKHFNGGDGKYRLGKTLDFNSKVDGIIAVNSMHENTNTVLKHILENKKKDLLKPYINLEFDYSSHGNMNFLLDSFLFYL
ncbi:CoA activase [Cetobacterium sp. 8H]|uniref:acyl-CoA dehydratase activase n=1 Tax=Cetobacterium sp. 8H TaxID=2759681 RepID=UPI00163CC8AC|nr:acyl-CoA dehydratase activase [Cetobacterium sp. 8H]MBC2852159.1 CoA activase [Cetobacterium sp. 8H]